MKTQKGVNKLLAMLILIDRRYYGFVTLETLELINKHYGKYKRD